jgi:hypothetical protein
MLSDLSTTITGRKLPILGVSCSFTYIDPGQVRVYIKDTLLKGYSQNKLKDPQRVRRILRIPSSVVPVETFRKPHGQLLSDDTVISWGRADDWRVVIISAYERAQAASHRRALAAVLLNTGGRFEPVRQLAADLASRLDVERVVWVD